jgi:hypothetical protein
LNPPDFTLASETILSNKLEFRVKAFLFIRTTGGLECLAV